MRPVYALSAVLDKHPNIISGAVLAWVNVLIALGVLELDGKEVSALNLAIAGTLALFVASKTANVAVLNELAQDPPTVEGVELAAKPVAPKRGKEAGQGNVATIAWFLLCILLVLVLARMLGVA